MKKPRPRARPEELQRLVHELRVQQLELERQHEEIRSTQRELEAERDRIADLYQLAPVAHLTLDRAGTIVEGTVLAVALLGVGRRRLAGRRLHELVVGADWATLSRHLADVFADAERRTCDLRILSGRDAVRLVRVSSVGLPDARGRLTRCRTALMDVTERKQAEEGLKDSRAQFESIVTSALDAIVIVSEDGRVMLLNPAAERMFGCGAASAIGHAFDRFVQESSRTWYRAAIMAGAAAEAGSLAPGRLGTIVARRADGTEFPVEASISEVAGSRGRLFTLILRDLSARQRAERALAERLRLEQLVTSLAMTFGRLSTVDVDREVERALRAVVDFLEVDRGGLVEFAPDGRVGRCWALDEWMELRDFPWLTARLQHGDFTAVSRIEALPAEAAIDRQSYLTCRVKPHVAVPLEAGGRVVGGLVLGTIGAGRATSDEGKQQLHLIAEVFANLLSRKQAELDLQKLRQDLGHISRVATIGMLTTSLAHELNQPLTAILSNAQAAQRVLGADPAALGEVREILDDIVEDDKRAGAVIHRLHGLLRKGGLELAELDVNELVGEVARLVSGDVALRQVSLRLDLAPRLPRVRGDRVQLQQVLLNLVLNGMEAMQGSGPGSRTLVLRTAAEGAAAVRISARDFGTGIPEADRDQIFQAFYTTKSAGLGMGLAIACSIVEAHGGRLDAENNADGGATFSFTLPVGGQAP